MRTSITLSFIVAVLLTACDKSEFEYREEGLTDGFCIVANDKVILNRYDFEYYDYSTHLIYLKNYMSFAKDIESIGGFKVYADGDEIYSGQTHPGYSSYLPLGSVVINTLPSFYADYIIPLTFFQITDTLGNALPDPRVDDRIVDALKKYDQFHAGLSCEIQSVQYLSSINVKVELLLTNNDSFNYYYLDPDKTGIGLFHYFTNGLIIRDLNYQKSYTHKMNIISPEPWNSWKKVWLSVIEGNKSKIITIIYDNFDDIPNGEYRASFEFPGLSSQVDKEDINQIHGQIWLGDLNVTKEITIE